jgi:hypothetical protein
MEGKTMLANTAVIVRFSVGSYSPTKEDKTLSRKTADEAGADRERVRVTKQLIARDAVKRYKDIETQARTYHYDNTVPWTKGEALLSIKNLEAYRAEMDRLFSEWVEQKHWFIGAYWELQEQARIALNGAFNPADYVPAYAVGEKFYWTLQFLPVPQAGHFVLSTESQTVSETIKELRTQLEEELHTQESEAIRNLWTRLFDVIARMVERLSKADAVFRDSLITNIRDMIDLASGFDDAELNTLRQRIGDIVSGIEPETLRDSRRIREKTAEAGMLILKEMGAELHLDAEEEVRKIRRTMEDKTRAPKADLAEDTRAVRNNGALFEA